MKVAPPHFLRARGLGNTVPIRDGIWCKSWHRVGAPQHRAFNEQVLGLPWSGEPRERESTGSEDPLSAENHDESLLTYYLAPNHLVDWQGVHILPIKK